MLLPTIAAAHTGATKLTSGKGDATNVASGHPSPQAQEQTGPSQYGSREERHNRSDASEDASRVMQSETLQAPGSRQLSHRRSR
jgi:hypothetical protein